MCASRLTDPTVNDSGVSFVALRNARPCGAALNRSLLRANDVSRGLQRVRELGDAAHELPVVGRARADGLNLVRERADVRENEVRHARVAIKQNKLNVCRVIIIARQHFADAGLNDIPC